MISVALIGANGYVGQEIKKKLQEREDIELTCVTRKSYRIYRNKAYDILINSAMPSRRPWAQENPGLDFIESVEKTANLVYGWRYKKFIQISTLSARCEPHIVYGRHRAMAEKLVESPNNLIIRLTAMYSPNISKGALFDMLQGNKVHLTEDSRFAFTALKFVGEWIAENLDNETGVIELGAKNSITLRQIADALELTPEFGEKFDCQEIQYPFKVGCPYKEFPDATEVIQFMKSMLKRKEKYDRNVYYKV